MFATLTRRKTTYLLQDPLHCATLAEVQDVLVVVVPEFGDDEAPALGHLLLAVLDPAQHLHQRLARAQFAKGAAELIVLG
jgi:hypothetical protein